MHDLWKFLKDFVNFNERKVYIDNNVFQLHYKGSVIILFGFAMLVTSKQYIGDPIDCISSDDVKKIADPYCWIHSTFTRGRKDDEGRWVYEGIEPMGEDEPGIKSNQIAPGIRPALEGDTPMYQTYYQWVWAVLFIQGCAFYFPHWLWSRWEGGRIKLLVADLNLQVIDEDAKTKHQEAILNYFTPNRGYHTWYAIKHLFCEWLNLANVFAQIYITDAFLNHEFSNYGWHVFSLSQQRPYLRHDALAKVFPTVTACRIATGGPAFGTVEYDLLCVLPLNILNEKLYIFLWFWFVVVAVVTCLGICFNLLTLCIPPLREYLLRRNSRGVTKEPVRCSYGDWFLLYRLGQNMNPIIFGELLKELAGRFDSSGKNMLVNSTAVKPKKTDV